VKSVIRVNSRPAKVKIRASVRGLPSDAEVEVSDLMLQPGNSVSGWLPHVTELPWSAGVSEETAMYPSTNLSAINSRVSDVENGLSSMSSELAEVQDQLGDVTGDWESLHDYVANDWQAGDGAGSSFYLRAQRVGKVVNMLMRTRRGSSPVITESLPEKFRSARQEVLPVWLQIDSDPLAILMENSGSMTLWPTGTANSVSDGSLGNLILRTSYFAENP